MSFDEVIKGLEVCTSKPCYCTDCPYKASCCLDSQEVMEDALALLKEQEAVEPVEVFRKDTNCHEYYCKRCGNKVGIILGGKHHILPGVKLSIEHFCDVCGQAVKWE